MRRILFLMLSVCFLAAPVLWADEAGEKLNGVLKEGFSSYESLKDYKATFIKQEREDGVLGEREEIYMKFGKPWKIYMEWLNTDKKGLQVAYERGQHDNKLVVHKPGLFLGIMPIVFLDQNSPWVKEGSASYNIEDAGIGTFLTDFAKAVEQSKIENKLKVEWLDEKAADVTFIDSKKDKIFFAYRIKTIFDEKSKLPIKMELFDWENKPMGIYSYENLSINIGDEDPEFKKRAQRQLYKIYQHLE